MAFQPGRSGNPGGRKKSIGLSRAVRKSEGLKTWKMLLDIRDEKIREQAMAKENGESIVVDVVPSIKERREACKLILAYCWGQPNPKMDFAENFELTTDDDPQQLLTLAVNGLVRGEIAAPAASGIASLVAASLKLKETTEVERRLTALEKASEARPYRQ